MFVEWQSEPEEEDRQSASPLSLRTSCNRIRLIMTTRSLLKRLEKAEGIAKAQSKSLSKSTPDCICFPEKEQPFFCSSYEEPIAALVKCPLHGKRFRRQTFFVYVASWLAEKEPARRQRLSPQYREAWEASFPPKLGPAVPREELEDGKIFFGLKDGTKFFVGENQRSHL